MTPITSRNELINEMQPLNKNEETLPVAQKAILNSTTSAEKTNLPPAKTLETLIKEKIQAKEGDIKKLRKLENLLSLVGLVVSLAGLITLFGGGFTTGLPLIVGLGAGGYLFGLFLIILSNLEGLKNDVKEKKIKEEKKPLEEHLNNPLFKKFLKGKVEEGKEKEALEELEELLRKHKEHKGTVAEADEKITKYLRLEDELPKFGKKLAEQEQEILQAETDLESLFQE